MVLKYGNLTGFLHSSGEARRETVFPGQLGCTSAREPVLNG